MGLHDDTSPYLVLLLAAIAEQCFQELQAQVMDDSDDLRAIARTYIRYAVDHPDFTAEELLVLLVP